MSVNRRTAIIEGKFSEHLEHGRVSSVQTSGTYIKFSEVFSNTPDVVVSGIGMNAQLDGTPDVGSVKVVVEGEGEADVTYIAWGPR